MNRFLIAIIAILVVAAGVYFYTTTQQDAPQPPADTQTQTPADTPPPAAAGTSEDEDGPGGASDADEGETSMGGSSTPSGTSAGGAPATGGDALTLTSDPNAPTTTGGVPGGTPPAGQAARSGEIPASAKVLTADYGLIQDGQPGGKLVVAGVTGPKTLNDLVGQETSTTDITNRLHKGLVEINPLTFEVEPALAERWEFIEDNTAILFHLRQGLKFSDGEPFTAADVVFTFNDLVFNPDVNNSYRDILVVEDEPLQFEAVDDYTVKVTMPKPFRPVLRTLGGGILPRHKLADRVSKLNPGVNGVLAYLRDTLGSNREALEALGVDAVEAIDWALNDLEAAIGAQDAEKANTAAEAVGAALSTLSAALTEGSETLGRALTSMLEQIQQAAGFAAAGKWQGVPVGTFNRTWPTNAPASEIVGLGPFKFVRYDVDQQVVLERNPYYWKVDENGVQLPYIEQLVVLYVENVETAVLKFRAGELDTRGIRPEDWPVFIEAFDAANDCGQTGIKMVCSAPTVDYNIIRAGPTFGTLFYALNQDDEDPALRAVFREVTYRQAMTHALDKRSIIDNIYSGLAVEQWSPVSVPSPYYDEEATRRFPFDLEEAARMLDELQLTDTDGDGTRNITDAFLAAAGVDPATLAADQQNEGDRELEYVIQTYSGSNTIEDTLNLMIADLKQIGVTMILRVLDFNALVTNLSGGTFDAIMVGFTGGVEPYNGRNLWTTDGNLHFWRYSSQDDPPAWEQRVDELFNLASSTFDEAQVKAYYAEFQQLVSEQLPLIYTVNSQFLYAHRAGLRNTDGFQAIDGNVSPVFAFAEVLWWGDESRRTQVDAITPQG